MLIILSLSIYFLLIIIGSSYFGNKVKSLEDFFLAGRQLKALPVATSFVASWFGAASTIGSVNAYASQGLSALWQIALPSICSCLLITFCFAKRVSDQNSLSQPEAIERHYGKTGRLLLSIIILASMTTFIGSQLVAAGKLFESVLGIDIQLSTLLVAGVVVIYSMIGGYFSVVITDMCHFVLFSLAILILFAFTTWGFFQGGEGLLYNGYLHVPPDFWNPAAHFSENIFMLITFVLAWSIAPEMWQRMSSTPNRRSAEKAAWIATLCLGALFLMVCSIGMLAPLFLPLPSPSGHGDHVLFDLALKLPYPFLTALVLVGVMAAITSTMDSSLNVGSLTLTQDLYHKWIAPKSTQVQLVWVGRLATVLIPIPAVFIALHYQNIIQVLWISADIYASTMFFPIVGILYLKNPGKLSGILAMALGGASMIVSGLVQYHVIEPFLFWTGWPYTTLTSVCISGIGYGV
ncbi:MAG: sodium:solute symporter family protein, partial [Cyanobacteria bacterium]|nr:sodium:solute symporter family protein [Cyanobacteriota bacterium]